MCGDQRLQTISDEHAGASCNIAGQQPWFPWADDSKCELKSEGEDLVSSQTPAGSMPRSDVPEGRRGRDWLLAGGVDKEKVCPLPELVEVSDFFGLTQPLCLELRSVRCPGITALGNVIPVCV
jgi:hypothetical protein